MIHSAFSATRQIALLVVLVGAAAGPAWAEHFVRGSHHRYVAASPHQPAGSQQQGKAGTAAGGSTPDLHENNSRTSSGNDTKQGEKGDAKTNRGESSPGDHNATAGSEAGGKGRPHGDDHAGGKPTGLSESPIDTSITIVGPPKSRHTLNARYGQKPKIGRLVGNSSHQFRASFRVTHDKIVRNSIGLPVHQVTVDSKGTDGAPKNVDPAGGGGTAVGPELHRQGFVPLTANGRRPDPPISTAMNRSVINGRDMIRPGMTNGAIGGAPKFGSGVIKGSDFRPRP